MWQPDITVAAICERDGKFLMVEERSKSSGKIVLNQPAGHLEDNETILQAVIRETLEETCCHFIPQAFVGLYRLRTEQGKTYIRYVFSGQTGDRDPKRQLDSDIIRNHWLSMTELKARSDLRSDLVLACLHDYLAGTRYSLNIIRET